MNNSHIDRYKKAEEEIQIEKDNHRNSMNRKNDITSLALEHYKNHHNWYKIKFNHRFSSERNRLITISVYDKFPGADENKIKKAVSLSGVFTIANLVILIIISGTFLFSAFIYFMISSGISTSMIVLYTFISVGIYAGSSVIFVLFYDTSSFLRFYRIKKEK